MSDKELIKWINERRKEGREEVVVGISSVVRDKKKNISLEHSVNSYGKIGAVSL